MITHNATSRAAGSPFGRIPSLTAQIKELIHDYPEGIGIIKELAQNADDAGARLLEVVIDRRTHPSSSLPVPAMSALQGPALLFVNDSVFTEDDFDRIQEIYRSGKVRAADKTGQFGKGFNTVYNVTDWPSFVTGERVAFFDPHCSLVPGATRLNPGRYWTLGECWDQFPDLLAPFAEAGLERGAAHFERTAFRLPFRTAAQAAQSEISRKPFGEESLNGLIAELAEVRESLLLFLKRLEGLRLREISATGARRDLVVVETTNVEEVRRKRGELLAALHGDATDVVRRLQGQSPVLISYRHEFRSAWADQNGGTATQDSTWRVLHCLNLDGAGKLAETVEAMLAGDVKAVPLGGAAARVVPAPDEEVPPLAHGRVYCSLPLPIETGLPVHLNGFFDLDSSRHSLTTETGLTGGARVRGRWNRLLVEHVVAPAYAHLIDHLAGDVGDENAPAYYGHWPRPDSPLAAPLNTLVGAVYRMLAPLDVVRVGDSARWRPVGKVHLLPPGWDDLGPPLSADGVALAEPALPDVIVAGFRQASVTVHTVSPQFVRDRLRQVKRVPHPGFPLAQAPRACLRQRAWLETLLRFCLSDGPKDLTDLPLALMAVGQLRSFGSDPKYLIFAAGTEERRIFSRQPHWFLDAGYAEACGLAAAPVPSGLSWMTPGEVLRLLPVVLPDGKGLRLNPDSEGAGFPTVGWLTSLYHYLLAVAGGGHRWSRDGFVKLPLVPDQTGTLHCPGKPSTPLLGHEEEMEGLGGVLQALGAPLVTAPPALRDAIAAFAAAVPNFIWKLTGPDLIDTLGSLDSDSFPDYRADVHPPLLDYLARPQWTAEVYRARPERLPDLRSLPIFPTADGRVVDLEGDVFIPGDYTPPACVRSVTLLQCGPANAWVRLLELAGVPRLTRARFIEDYLLPEYPALAPADKLTALRWLRDNLDRAQTEVEDEEGAAESLREALGAAELIRCTDKEFRSAVDVYDPDSELIRDLFGDTVPYPDPEYFERGWERWKDFFRGLGLVSVPEAPDLVAYIDRLCEDAESGVSGRLAGRILKVFEHIDDRWAELSRQPVGDDDEEDLASALRERAWLPAETSARGLRRWPGALKPEDRLYRPDELHLPAQANLVSSQRPIFARARIKAEVQRALGFLTEVPLDTALEHLDRLLALWESGDRPTPEVFESALQDVYRHLAGFAKSPAAAGIAARYAGVACLWYRRRLWDPEHAFRAKVPFFGDRRVTIHVKEASIRPAYPLLGMRESPCLDDYLAYLDELVEEFGENPLPEDEVDRLVEVYRRIGEEYRADEAAERTFPLLTEDRVLVDSEGVFYDDAPWFRDRIQDPRVRFLHRGLPVTVTQLRWVRSLAGEVKECPTGDGTPTRNPEASRRVVGLEALIRSPEFRHGVGRLVYHEHGVHRTSIAGWLAGTSVVALRELTSELVLPLDGEDTVVGSGPANQYLDFAENRILLDGNAGKLIRPFLAEAINTGLSEHRLQNLSPLEVILDCEPAEIDQTLTRLRIKPIDDEMAFAPPEANDEWSDDSDEPTEAIEDSPETGDPSGDSVESGEAAGGGEVEFPEPDAEPGEGAQPAGDDSDGERTGEPGDGHHATPARPLGPPSHSGSPAGRGGVGGSRAPSSGDAAPRRPVGDAPRDRVREPARGPADAPATGSSSAGTPSTESRPARPVGPPTTNPNPRQTPGTRTGAPGAGEPTGQERHSPHGRTSTPPNGQHSGGAGTDRELRMRRRDRRRRERSERGRDRIVTYVSFGSGGATDSPPPVLSETERMERIALGDAAADLVCAFEREHGRNPVKLAHNHPGWDVDSFDVRRVESGLTAGSAPRMIEVKGIRGPWTRQGVAISRRQFEAAREYGERYWLYVVEFADDPSRARIHPIHNPYSRITQFWFDGGWRQLADPAEAPSAACRLVVGQRISLGNAGEGVVERLEERGALRVVHVRLDDGTLVRRPFNPATMRPAGG
ncbi:MAG: DUF3883 domain-containing protein [Gemmataceae bacterium]|nr:DUF3883 domain-containing protein [Gemmataceae bacterium]